MIKILSFLAVGIIVGLLIQKKKKLIVINDKLMTWAIFGLLFLLGISVGLNDTIMDNLDTIGLKALIITIGAVIGSVLVAWIIFPFLFPEAHKSKKKNDEE